jgi:SpoVK/Ycf46/Vps4 family AAA+-type ATPase
MIYNYYKSSFDHLVSELARIDFYIRKQYRNAKQQFENKGEFHGLYISDDEAETLTENPLALPGWATSVSYDGGLKSDDDLELMIRDIEKKIAETRKHGIEMRLDRLRTDFGLCRKDLDILLLLLSSEISAGYEKIFAYLQDDLTRKKPSVELVLNILSSNLAEKMSIRSRLTAQAPLVVNGIVHASCEPTGSGVPFISRFLHVDERIVEYLLYCGEGDETVDRDISGKVRVVEPEWRFDDLVLPSDTVSRLKRISSDDNPGNCRILFFSGPYGTGKKTAAEAFCRSIGRKMLAADIEKIVEGQGVQEFSNLVLKVLRESVLWNALVFWDRAECLFTDDRKRYLLEFMSIIENRGGLSILAGKDGWEPGGLFSAGDFIPVSFFMPTYSQRIELWNKKLSLENMRHSVRPETFASAFTFSGGQIRDAVQTARNLSIKKTEGEDFITEEDLKHACLLQSNRKLSALARQIRPTFNWDDIVLPDDRIEQLKDIVNHARHKSLVLESWGFGRKLSYGKGLSVLFSGPSGTGKTMSAEIMASDLGLYLYKIDLARVVSKYIGETEKNLSKIFEEAETSNAILFFDEADAIFGKRSEVHDAHDRYANIETSYLLQRMEEYEGITILATNFKRNMDEAFVRRIQYAVEFPFPDTHHRREIWQKTWPLELPLSGDIDFDLLASRFEMSGGNIKNICLNAAFIAAGDGKVVTMSHLMKATRNEYRKMGKLHVSNEFSELKRAGNIN